MRHPIIVTPTYKLTALCCLGLLTTSFLILNKTYKNQRLCVLHFGNVFGTVLTAFLIYTHLQKGMFDTGT